MIDTLNFWISREDLASGNPFAISSFLTDVMEHNSQSRGYSMSGHLRNYIVSCFQWGITFKGSMAKYKYNQNFSTLSRSALEEAIDEMSEDLQMDLRVGVVSRIDISTNITTNHPPSQYFKYLGNIPRYKRLNLAIDTLEYRQKKSQLSFYDKMSQAKKERMEIPSVLDGEHCLRYEFRMLDHVKTYAKTPDKTRVGDVITPEYYANLIECWRNGFKKISKTKNMDSIVEVKTRPDAKNVLFARYLNEHPNIINDFVQELKSSKCFQDKKEYSRLKQDLEKIKASSTGKQVDLISELENKIDDVARYKR